MAFLSTISDSELLAHVPVLLTTERAATAELIAYLAEIDRRRLYLEQACTSLRSFCIERLGYSEDEASKRVRVAHLVRQLPSVLDELRSGAIHLTGLFLLAPYLTVHNADALLGEARGLSRHAIEQLIARWFPRPGVESRIDPVAGQSALPLGQAASGRPAASIGPGTDRAPTRAQLEPLSASVTECNSPLGTAEHFAVVNDAWRYQWHPQLGWPWDGAVLHLARSSRPCSATSGSVPPCPPRRPHLLAAILVVVVSRVRCAGRLGRLRTRSQQYPL